MLTSTLKRSGGDDYFGASTLPISPSCKNGNVMCDARIGVNAMARRKDALPTRRPREEAARLGKKIYKRDILPQIEADHFGEYVAIDVDRGGLGGG